MALGSLFADAKTLQASDGASAFFSLLSKFLEANMCNFDANQSAKEQIESLAASGAFESSPLETIVVRNDHFVVDGFQDSIARPLVDQFRHLRHLSISRCPLGKAGFAAIGNALKTRNLLEDVSISFYHCTEDISRLEDFLQGFADGISRTTSLRTLTLHACDLRLPDYELIAESLKSNSSLLYLVLNDNPEAGAASAVAMANALRCNNSLKTLEMKHNEIKSEGADAIFSALESNTSLTRLNLAYNLIEHVSKASFLTTNHALHELNISYNDLRPLFVNQLAEALKHNQCRLSCINLSSYNPLPLDEFMDSIATNSTLTSLELNNESASESSLERLGRSLKSNASLANIIMTRHMGCHGDFEHLLESLLVSKAIRHLALPRVGLTKPDALLIAAALATTVSLNSLDLSHNKLGDAGIAEIGHSLCRNQSLTRLKMVSTGCAAKGIRALANALCTNECLRVLKLDENLDIEDEDAVGIGSALMANRALIKLSLCKTSISRESSLSISEAIKVNTTLQVLRLRGCPINTTPKRSIGEALKHNTTLQRLEIFKAGVKKDESDGLASDPRVR